MTTWHIITGEYPPSPGGVSDYTHAVALGLAAEGDRVHVWCPGPADGRAGQAGVEVHPVAGSWSRSDCARVDAALDALPGPRRLLVQWVPHAYGHRALNVAFCRWVSRRARRGDILDLMVHEPFLAFREGSLRHDAAAAVQRLMMAILLRRASRVWVAIPAWAALLRPWTFGRDVPFSWLPVPSTIPVVESNGAVPRFRTSVLGRPDGCIAGHFGTYTPATRRDLQRLLPQLLADVPELQVQLLGRGGEEIVNDFRASLGRDGARVQASGPLSAADLSCRLQACDFMLQPYIDGASTRRTTLMAALAHGLPVVTTVGRLSEPFWRDSDAIAAVPAGDIQAFGQMASAVARDPGRRIRLAEAARATYAARFGLPHVIAALRADAAGAIR